MEGLQLDVQVEHDLQQLVGKAVAAIVSATEAAAHQLRDTHIPQQAPVGPSGDLSDPSAWLIEERDPLTRVVSPGSRAFYAHIVARGRGEVRPVSARALTVAGRFVAAAGGHAGNPFHDRALDDLEQTLDALLDAALAEELS